MELIWRRGAAIFVHFVRDAGCRCGELRSQMLLHTVSVQSVQALEVNWFDSAADVQRVSGLRAQHRNQQHGRSLN
eukprot:3199064-Rhodomonas_salina.1